MSGINHIKCCCGGDCPWCPKVPNSFDIVVSGVTPFNCCYDYMLGRYLKTVFASSVNGAYTLSNSEANRCFWSCDIDIDVTVEVYLDCYNLPDPPISTTNLTLTQIGYRHLGDAWDGLSIMTSGAWAFFGSYLPCLTDGAVIANGTSCLFNVNAHYVATGGNVTVGF